MKSREWQYREVELRRKGKITMYEYIKKIIKECSDPLRNKWLSSPNTSKLFKVRKNAIPLDEGMSKFFHSLVA